MKTTFFQESVLPSRHQNKFIIKDHDTILKGSTGTLSCKCTKNNSKSTTFKAKKNIKIKDLKDTPKNNRKISDYFKSKAAHEKNEDQKEKHSSEISIVANINVKIDVKLPKSSVVVKQHATSTRDHKGTQISVTECYSKKKKTEINKGLDATTDTCKNFSDLVEEEHEISSSEEKQAEVSKPIEKIQTELINFLPPRSNSSHQLTQNLRKSNVSNAKPTEATSGFESQSPIKTTCPKYKFIYGTTFVVDAFNYGYIDQITHYFLTHFHSKEYMGLSENFNRPIVLSSITAKYVKKFCKIDSKYIILLDSDKTIKINGITITAIDANQYVCVFF